MKLRLACLTGIALVLATSCAAQAEDGASLAAKFGALEDIQQIAMSPDGNHISYVASAGLNGQVLFIADLVNGGAPKAVIREQNKDDRLASCFWATNEKLVCRIATVVKDAGLLLSFTRLLTINSDGSGVKMLTKSGSSQALGLQQDGGSIIDWDLPNAPGHVLMTRQFVPEMQTGTLTGRTEDGIGVEDVDIATLTHKIVEAPKTFAEDYISDGRGSVRIMSTRQADDEGRLSNTLNFYYRAKGSREWKKLSQIKGSNDDTPGEFIPYAVDPDKDVAYGYDVKDGHRALYSVALDGTGKREVVLSRPDVDIDGLIRIGSDSRVVGASYATERRMNEFFDPALKKLGAGLTKALPGSPNIDFIDSSSDESKLLLFASSDTNSGMFYRYDKASHQLNELLPSRSALAGLALGSMKPVSYPAADGTLIPGYLTLPPGSSGKGIPAIVMPHGGPSARDEWGFDWLVQFYATRGFAVLQPNYRGSSGYGSDWYQRNGFQSWKTAIGDVNDAGRWLVSQGIAAPDKLAIVGWSYGGYAALQTSVLDPDLFKAIVAIAPVTDLDRWKQESAEFTNSALVNQFVGSGPHIKEGSPAQNAAKIKAPVLLFHGDLDQNVGVGESRLMESKLRSAGKQVQYVEFKGLAHSLADAAARTRLLGESDAFLRKSLGLPAN